MKWLILHFYHLIIMFLIIFDYNCLSIIELVIMILEHSSILSLIWCLMIYDEVCWCFVCSWFTNLTSLLNFNTVWLESITIIYIISRTSCTCISSLNTAIFWTTISIKIIFIITFQNKTFSISTHLNAFLSWWFIRKSRCANTTSITFWTT